MRIEGMSLLVAGALFATSCTKPPPPLPPPATPKPAATPHPATGAKEAAIRLYPDLGKKDSTFNRTFLEVMEERRQKSPNSLASVDWPLDVAHRTAAILGVMPASAEPDPLPPPPAPVIVVAPTPKPPNALERGAYNQKSNVARPPVIVDRDGYRVR